MGVGNPACFLGSRVAQDPWHVSLRRRFRPFVPYHTPRAGFLAAPYFLLPASAAATVPTWTPLLSVGEPQVSLFARDECGSCIVESGGNLEAAGWRSGVGYNPSLPVPSLSWEPMTSSPSCLRKLTMALINIYVVAVAVPVGVCPPILPLPRRAEIRHANLSTTPRLACGLPPSLSAAISFIPLASIPALFGMPLVDFRWPGGTCRGDTMPTSRRYMTSMVRSDPSSQFPPGWASSLTASGSVVRVAPNELSFCSAGAWEDIYGFRVGIPAPTLLTRH